MPPSSFLSSSLIVALGGAFGAWLRYATSVVITRAIGAVAASTFPFATLTVNVAGSFAMGLLAGWLGRHGGLGALGGEHLRLLIGVGILGGFTTFSAFSLEFVLLVERGTPAAAALYVALSLTAGIGGLIAGLALMRVLA
jgi:CrcB protein